MTDQERAELFRTMIADAGTYAFDGKNLECHLDVSWNQAWTGTDIQRHVTFEGRRLICQPVLTRATSMAT
jgi:Lipocalin-like domain